MWSIRPETDCSVFPPLACLKGRCNLAQRYAQMAVATVARRRHRCKDRCREIVWCRIFHVCVKIFGPSGLKKGETYHLSSNVMFELAHAILFFKMYCSLFGIWVDQSPACSVLLLSRERTKPVQKLLGQIYGRKKGVIKKHRHDWDYHSWFHFPSSLPTSQKSRGTIAKEIMRQHGPLMRVSAPSAHSKMTFLYSH